METSCEILGRKEELFNNLFKIRDELHKLIIEEKKEVNLQKQKNRKSFLDISLVVNDSPNPTEPDSIYRSEKEKLTKRYEENLDQFLVNYQNIDQEIAEAENPQKALESYLRDLERIEEAREEIAISFSGGVMHGVAYAGVIKALKEAFIFPQKAVGSSVGSILAALTYKYQGIQNIPEEVFDYIEKYLCAENLFPLNRDLRSVPKHLADPTRLNNLLQNLFQDTKMGEAGNDFDLTIITMEQKTGKCIFLANNPPESITDYSHYPNAKNVPLWKAVAASCFFPMFFPPVEIKMDDRSYFLRDGSFWGDFIERTLKTQKNVGNTIAVFGNFGSDLVHSSSEYLDYFKKPIMLWVQKYRSLAKSVLGEKLREIFDNNLSGNALFDTIIMTHNGLTNLEIRESGEEADVLIMPKHLGIKNRFPFWLKEEDIEYLVKQGYKATIEKIEEILDQNRLLGILLSKKLAGGGNIYQEIELREKQMAEIESK